MPLPGSIAITPGFGIHMTHPGLWNRTSRPWCGIAFLGTHTFVGLLSCPYITIVGYCSEHDIDPVGKSVLGIDVTSPSNKSSSTASVYQR